MSWLSSALTEICLSEGFLTVTVKIKTFEIERELRLDELCKCVCEFTCVFWDVN